MTPFFDQLAAAVRAKRSPLVVGLDPRADSLPHAMAPSANSPAEIASAYREFCCAVVDATAGCAAAAKPQAAFFEELGPPGVVALVEVIRYCQAKNLLVILDAKRGDIGTTAEAYARGLVGRHSPWGGDALTVNPYLGDDSLTPFVSVAQERGAGLFVLVKTSNPGGKLWQDRPLESEAGVKAPLYRHVGEHVEHLARNTRGACGYGVVGAVVGATYPQQLAELRAAMPHTWFLIPGFGAQGGSAADTAAGFDPQGLGAVVNSSRGVIFAHKRAEFAGLPWQEAVHRAAIEAAEQLRASTPAGKL